MAEARNRIWVAWTSDESLRQVKLGSFDPTAPQAELQGVTAVSGGPRARKPALAAGAETVALLFTSTFGGSEHLLLRLF